MNEIQAFLERNVVVVFMVRFHLSENCVGTYTVPVLHSTVASLPFCCPSAAASESLLLAVVVALAEPPPLPANCQAGIVGFDPIPKFGNPADEPEPPFLGANKALAAAETLLCPFDVFSAAAGDAGDGDATRLAINNVFNDLRSF